MHVLTNTTVLYCIVCIRQSQQQKNEHIKRTVKHDNQAETPRTKARQKLLKINKDKYKRQHK